MMSATTQLNKAAKAAITTFVFKLLIAICWIISTTAMWVAYAIHPSAILAGAIAFTGIALVHIGNAASSYGAYTKARNASISHK